MMEIQNKFIYKLTDRLGTILVVPLGESEFTIDYEREDEDKNDYQKKVSGKIVFIKGAYKRIMIMENSVYRCEEQNLSIYKLCNGVEKLIFSGKISLNQADFNLDKCNVTLKFLDDTKDKCIDDNKSTKINLFNLVFPRREVKLSTAGAVIESRKCTLLQSVEPGDGYVTEYWCGTGDPFAQNWVVVENIVEMRGLGNGGTLTVNTTWIREIIEIDCADIPETDWILIEDNCGTTGKEKYAKLINTYECKYDYQNFTDQWNFDFKYSCKYIGGSEGTGSGVQKLRNGILFNDSLIELVKNACPGLVVKSDFFQINPDNISLINYVTNEKSTVNEIMIFQKSDVKRPTAQNIATKLEVDLESILETLLIMFNVKWRIEANVFRIEHVSYFSKSNGFDVTIGDLKKYFVGKSVYSYQSENIPQKEFFLFKEQGPNLDYKMEVEYFGCVTNKKKNEVKYIVEDVMTDVQLCLANPSSENKTVDDNGIVLVSTRKVMNEYFINSEPSVNGRIMNNVFAWVQLFRKYHYYQRPMRNGEVNGVMTNFISTIPTKKGDTFAIPLNVCSQIFNPDQYVKTALGTGIVSSAKYRLKDSFLELDLLYESNQDLNQNEPPVLVGGGIFSTYMNVLKHLTVVVTDGDGVVQSLQSPTVPANGMLNFISNTEFEYIPNADFVGDDYFTLKAIDNFSEVSNIVNFLIHVYPQNQPPTANDETYNVYHGETFNQGSSIFSNDSDDHGFTIVNPNLTTTEGVNVVIDSAGFFNYVPPVDFEGNDYFDYEIQDELGLISGATVTLVVRFKNRPIAIDDFYQTQIDTVFSTDGTIGKRKVIDNDYSADGVSYTFTTFSETKPTTNGGSVSIGNDGNFTYTPPTGFTGKDSFNYTVLNINGSDMGKVEISVLPVIYVQKTSLNQATIPITIVCGEPPSGHFGGQKETIDFVLRFFLDSAKTIPIDVTGLDFKVKLRETTTLNYSGTPIVSNEDYETGILNGIEKVLYSEYVVGEDQVDCLGQLVYQKDVEFSILPGSYLIVT